MTCSEGDAWIEELRNKLKEGTENNSNHHLTQHQHILRYKNRICVGGTGDCRKILIKELHDSSRSFRDYCYIPTNQTALLLA